MRLLVPLLLLLLLPARSVQAEGGDRKLGQAAVYVSFRLDSGYQAFAEVLKILPRRVRTALPMLSLGLSRELGFDPVSDAWVDTAGVDGAAPVWASFFSTDQAATGARLGRVEQAARRHLAAASRGTFVAADVAGPLAWIRHRLVIKLRDETRARGFLKTLADRQRGRAVSLEGAQGEISSSLASLLGLGATQAGTLAEGLRGQQVLLLARPDRNLLVLYRILDGLAIVDVVTEAMGLPEKPEDRLRAGLLAALVLPTRPALDRGGKGLGRRVFTRDVDLGALIVARPFLAMMSEDDAATSLRRSVFGASAEGFTRSMREAQACRKSFAPGTVPVGDLGLQLRGDRKGLRAQLLWAAPKTVTRALAASAARRDLVDVTEWQTKVVALAGLGVELGPLLKALPRSGAFKLSAKAFGERSRACSGLAGGTVLLGGWVGLLGALSGEARESEQASLLVEHARSAVVLISSLSSLSRPELVAQVGVAAAGAARLRASLARLAHERGRPENLTFGGHATTVHPYLKAPLEGYSLGASDLKKEGLMVTLSNSRGQLMSFLGLTPPSARVLPAHILAFAHAQLPKLLTALQGDPAFKPVGKLLRDVAKRLEDLGANLSLSDGALLAEIHIGLKQP